MVTRVHFVPFQCRARVWLTPPIIDAPTAQLSVLDVPLTAKGSSSGLRLGLATWAHFVPFQCRVNVVDPLAVEV